MNIYNLIEDVIKALANNEPLKSVTSKVQVISRLLKNERFKNWVDCEFVNGYNSPDDVPKHRKIFIVGVRANYVSFMGFGRAVKYTNQNIPIENLGADIYKKIAFISVTDTVGIIQNAIRPDKDIYLAIGPHESSYIQDVIGDCQIMGMYKVVSGQQFQRIVDNTKAQLLDFFIELNDSVFDDKINFDVMTKKREIEQIVNNTIYAGVVNTGEGKIEISNSAIVGGKDNQTTIAPDIKQQLNKIISQVEALSQDIDDNKADIEEAIGDIKKELNGNTPKRRTLKMLFSAIKGMVAGFADKGIEMLAEEAIKLL